MRSSAILVLAAVVGCGARTGMLSDDGEPAFGGGANGSAGSASVGGASFAGRGGANGGAGSGGAVGSGGAHAGMSNGGASNGGASNAGSSGEAGSAGEPTCIDPQLVAVLPRALRVDVQGTNPLLAELSCPYDPNQPLADVMRANGRYGGLLPGAPLLTDPREVSLRVHAPDMHRLSPYFPGELVTGWVSPALGGPFQWQFTAATRAKEPSPFTDTGQALHEAQEVELADLDHDGDLDLVTGRSFDNVGRVWANDGNGNFTLRANLPSITEPVLGDVDGDGNVDIIADRLLMNDGNFGFTPGQALGAVQAAFDADGDGDLDVFAQEGGDRATISLNDGKGLFPSTALLLPGDLFDAKAGDLDNDGDLDLVGIIYDTAAMPRVARTFVLLNDGKAHFTEIPTNLKYDATRTLALGDVNGDGTLDVFLASWGAAGARNPDDQVWLNDGTANFTLGDSPLSGSIHITLQDLDGDGDLDAIAGQHAPYSVVPGLPSRTLINDGHGHFSTGFSVGGPNFQHIATGDLDGDGDLDVVVAQWDWTLKPPVQVWLQDN